MPIIIILNFTLYIDETHQYLGFFKEQKLEKYY